MTRLSTLFVAVALAGILLPRPAYAQQPRWGFELRADAGISTQDAARDTHENGFGFGAAIQYRVLPHLALYGGWDWTRYQALEAIAGPDVDLEETGYVAGARFEHPIGSSRTRGWARIGALYKHFELEDADGTLLDDSGHGLGWEAGAGVTVPLGDSWSLLPGVRYRSVSRDVEVGAVGTEVELQAVAFELAVRRLF
jgi:opacity protein-like surface antigen